MKRSLVILPLLLFIACSQESPKKESWSDSIVYEIFVRSFYDSDGDGIGDLKGIEMKLNYIQNLGANVIWLMPIFESPSYHCYDVMDYYQIEKDYGSMEDFESLMLACDEKGIRVILDLVLNHTSSQHPWFIKSIQGEAPYEDFYIWKDEPPGGLWYVYGKNDKVENGGWRFHEERGQYFYGYFTERMPDLNMENPAVKEEVKKIARFWLDKGVDGFRLDAAQNVIEEGPGDGLQYDSPSTIAWWVEFNEFVKSVNPEAALVGEIWASPDDLSRYFAGGKGLDLCFNFPLQFAILHSLISGTSDSIVSAINEIGKVEAPAAYFSPFLSNHDQERYMTSLGIDFQKAKIAAVVLFTSPGTPFLYYGEEIGMHQSDFSHNTTRTPMQWTRDSLNAGFTSSEEPWARPGNSDDPFNVKYQRESDSSLLNFYRTISKIRHKYPALRYGDYVFHEFDDRVLAYTRAYQKQELLILMNLTTMKKEIDTQNIEGNYIDLITQKLVKVEPGLFLDPLDFLLLEKK